MSEARVQVGLEFHLEKDFTRLGYRLYLIDRDGNGQTVIAQPVLYSPHDSRHESEPMMFLSRFEAADLLRVLYEVVDPPLRPAVKEIEVLQDSLKHARAQLAMEMHRVDLLLMAMVDDTNKAILKMKESLGGAEVIF